MLRRAVAHRARDASIGGLLRTHQRGARLVDMLSAALALRRVLKDAGMAASGITPNAASQGLPGLPVNDGEQTL